jgi:hypothetical protein
MASKASTLVKEFVLERKTSPVARKARNNPFLTKKLTPRGSRAIGGLTKNVIFSS